MVGWKRPVDWLCRWQNPFWKQIATVLFPRVFFNRIIEAQKGFGPFCVLSFDCDFPRDIEVFPQLIALLKRYGFIASFASVGQWVRKYPDKHRLLIDSGHELVNHTETHPNLYHADYDYARGEGLSRHSFNEISPAGRKEEIERCHATFEELLGYIPRGFRSPHFGALRVDDLYGILTELGYSFSSSVLAADQQGLGLPYRTREMVWEFPLSPCPEHPFGVFDSWHSLGKHRASHKKTGEVTGLFAILAEVVERDGGFINVYFDPREIFDSGELEGILRVLKEREIRVVDYGTLVEHLNARSSYIDPD